MKTRFTKLIALLLAVLMLTSLCACSADESTGSPDDDGGDVPTLPSLPAGFIPGDPIPVIPGGSEPTNGNASEPSQGNDDENKDQTPEIHDLQYYLSLPEKRNENYVDVKYTGQIVLNHVTYAQQPTFKQLMEKYPGMAAEKDIYVNAYTQIQVAFQELPEDAFLFVKNMSSNRIKLIDMPITGASLPIDENTKLTDLIGEQSKEIDSTMTFIDAAVEVIGLPFMVTEQPDGSLYFFFDYEECTVYITYNIESNTGRFDIEYK